MKLRMALLAAAALAASPASFGGEPDVDLYGGKAQTGTVKPSGWGDCKVSEKKSEAGKAWIEIAAPESAKQWCGATISFEQGLEERPPLSAEMLEKGFLCFKVNGGLDEFDRAAGGQAVQIAIGQKSPAKSGGFHPLSSYLPGGSVDSDPETWQEAKIPLKTLAGGSGLKSVDSLRLQFIGSPPPAPLLVKDVRLSLEK